MAKLLSASQVLTIKRKTIQLDGAWGDCLGEIDRTGVVLVWGQSGNGKSSAVMSLAKELTKHGKFFMYHLRRATLYHSRIHFDAIRCKTANRTSKW